MTNKFLLGICFIGLSAFSISPAHADTVTDDDQDCITIAAEDMLSDDAMDVKRGAGSDTTTVVSDQTLTSVSSGNMVIANGNLTNGSITTGSNFGGSGFGSFVLNTGNNATINSGVSLSVLMMP